MKVPTGLQGCVVDPESRVGSIIIVIIMADNNIEICPDGHRCKNGSSCREKRLDEGRYACDCKTIGARDVYAGAYCDFRATEYCNQENAVSSVSFCTNGKCRDKSNTSTQDAHQGCECNFGYAGDVSGSLTMDNQDNAVALSHFR